MAGMLKISVPGWPISGGVTRGVRPTGPRVLDITCPTRALSGLGKEHPGTSLKADGGSRPGAGETLCF